LSLRVQASETAMDMRIERCRLPMQIGARRHRRRAAGKIEIERLAVEIERAMPVEPGRPGSEGKAEAFAGARPVELGRNRKRAEIAQAAKPGEKAAGRLLRIDARGDAIAGERPACRIAALAIEAPGFEIEARLRRRLEAEIAGKAEACGGAGDVGREGELCDIERIDLDAQRNAAAARRSTRLRQPLEACVTSGEAGDREIGEEELPRPPIEAQPIDAEPHLPILAQGEV